MAITFNPNSFANVSFKSNQKTPVNIPTSQKEMIPTEDKPLSVAVSDVNSKNDVLDLSQNLQKIESLEKSKPTEVKALKPADATQPIESPDSQKEPVQQPAQSPVNPSQGLVSKSYNAISKTSAIAKGIVDGIISGLVFGTIVAGVDMVYSGIKKLKNKEIKFTEIFNPKKSMSKLGRNMSYFSAIGIMAGTIFSEYLQANKKNK